MKYLSILLALAVPALGAVLDNTYELKLILEGDGEDAVLRLTDENIPAHVSLDSETAISGRDATLAPRANIWCDPTHRNLAPRYDCRVLADSIRYSLNVISAGSTRHITYNSCYFSWSGDFNGHMKDLYSPSLGVVNGCPWTEGSTTYCSGTAEGYLPNSVGICVSNRASPCG